MSRQAEAGTGTRTVRTRTAIRRLASTLSVCALAGLATAACGESPTDVTPSGITGTWVGDLQHGVVQGHVRLSLDQLQRDSIAGSGELRWSGAPPIPIEISNGRVTSRGKFDLWMSVDGQPGWGYNGQVSPRQDVIEGLLGSPDGWTTLWLYRR